MKNKIILTLIFILLIGSSAFAAGTFYFGGKKQALSGSTDEVQAGYYDHQLLTTMATGLTSANIKAGTTLFGITGTYGAGGMLPPTLTTTAVSNITHTTASSEGNISTDGGSPVTARGVCWNTSDSPTTAESKTDDGTGTGSFPSSITGLTAGTTYYVRAYATNSVGTSYGNQVSFTTTGLTLATLTTTAPTAITLTTAISGGNITDNGGAPITERGICYSINHDPTTAGSKETSGSGTGIFTSSITGLTAGTTYYVRAYAANSVGTAYGDEVSFITVTLPLFIGQSYAGGKIFYIDGSGLQGLIVALSDQSRSDWSNITNTEIGTTGTAIGTGQSNTNAIIGQLNHTASAAKICDVLVITSEGAAYSDWFLPSKDELNLIYVNKGMIGNFPGNAYWSSTEYGSNVAWCQFFATGTQSPNSKGGSSLYVRAVRKF